MKKNIMIAIMVFAVVSLISANAFAITIDRTATVTATGSVDGSTSMSIVGASLDYGVSSADRFPVTPANKKVVITYTSNYNPWKLRISTNNTTVPLAAAANGRYSKGGLISPTTGTAMNVTACKWVTKAGGSTVPTVPSGANLYNFVKDIRDEDDPATALPQNESWAAAEAVGYPNIAFGIANSTGFCVDPTNTAPGPTQYTGDAISGTVDLYIAAQFGTGGVSPTVPSGAGTYGTTFTLELYHE